MEKLLMKSVNAWGPFRVGEISIFRTARFCLVGKVEKILAGPSAAFAEVHNPILISSDDHIVPEVKPLKDKTVWINLLITS